MYIGVYGTLRKNQRANYMMNKTEFIGTFTEKLPFTMVDLGSFPALLDSEELKTATFEVYKIDDEDNTTLIKLDSYEGYPSFYNRKTVLLKNDMEVWFYFIKKEESAYHGTIIENGDWMSRK